ncbi:sensor histidine kinase [Aliterella atlantica]|uniref:sensor histidine kinase n=1 Tax=Aliterella atlantica TaxID=1827278 RepID=UPI0005D413B2|nr:HAMP domain-containing sensor histidine kinase [Aliterella atlantica]
MQKWILPTLSELLALSPDKVQITDTQNSSEAIALREWSIAIAATEELLLQNINCSTSPTLPPQGIVLASPAPVWSHEALLANLSAWVFVPETLTKAERQLQLPPAVQTHTQTTANLQQLPLLCQDPLAQEQFCLVLTDKFSLILVLGTDERGNLSFQFSFEPEIIEQAWQLLRSRLLLFNSHSTSALDTEIAKYHPTAPDYRTVSQFSRLLLKHAQSGVWQRKAPLEPTEALESDRPTLAPHASQRPDIELLQAFAHEIRTPLTTIRTLTRLVLKRKDLAPEVKKRLETIDRECTEQIERMELMLRAAEIVEKATVNALSNAEGFLPNPRVKNTIAQLTAMSLDRVLQQSIPRWQQQASRRNLTLDVVVPQHLPTVVSDPNMLDRILTSLIENFTRNLAAGSQIKVHVIPAGNQLKLQLLYQSQSKQEPTPQADKVAPTVKSLGQLLIFQPETGNISLNIAATKHLFQAIGGKLIVRQRPDEGEILTIFLPMEVSHSDFYAHSLGSINHPVV